MKKKEIMSDVFLGGTVTKLNNGKGYVPILNTRNSPIVIDASVKLEGEEVRNFNELRMANINHLSRHEEEVSRVYLLLQAVEFDKTLNKEERNSMQKIFKDYSDVFHLKGDMLSYTTVLEHEIPTEMGRPPVNTRQSINSQVNKMLEDGIIIQSESPWNSPIILVPKKAEKDGETS